MIGKFKYTDKELKAMLDSLTVIIDTREQKNKHITKYLNDKKKPYISQAMKFGDYSCMLPRNDSLMIMRDIYFTDNIVIERKAHLEELSGNLTEDGGTRFEQELIKSKDAKFYLMIENSSYSDLVNHKYNTKYNEVAFLARLKTFESEYSINTCFIDGNCSGNFIYYTFKYWLRNQLKKGLNYEEV